MSGQFESSDNNNSVKENKWSILEDYGRQERRRVDILKDELREGRAAEHLVDGGVIPILDYREDPSVVRERFEKEKIERRPSTLKKMGRALLDMFGISLPGSYERRRREAMSVALKQVQREEALLERERIAEENWRKEEERKREEARISEENWRKEEERRREQIERQQDGIELLRATGMLSDDKTDRIRSQRIFENNERELNQKLTRVEDLRLLALDPEQSGIDRREIEYEGGEVTLYDMHKEPFAGLVVAIDYRSDNEMLPEGRRGKGMQDELMKDPSLWSKSLEEVQSLIEERGAEARISNTISTSYINTEHSNTINQHSNSKLMYGFDNVSAMTIMRTAARDAGTPMWQDEASNHDTIDSISRLEKMDYNSQSDHYNEIAIKRYDEKGRPKLPDYILARNGQINEDMLRHAAYFGIPIVNIDYSPEEK